MNVFESQIKTQSPQFQSRSHCMKKKTEELNSKLKEVLRHGSLAEAPSLQKYKKLPVRLKIEKLLDPQSQFLEFSALAGMGMEDTPAPCAGLITGIGSIEGRECMVIANDPTVKGGAYFPITVKKQLRAQEIAMENHLPCFYLVDSGGAYLPRQAELFADRGHFGSFFYNQSQMSALSIQQIAIVFGHCTAGGAYIPALSDQVIMVKNQGAIFLGGPPLVFSVTGERVSAEELGGAGLHAQESGLSDYTAESEEDALKLARSLLTKKKQNTPFLSPIKQPLYSPDELYGLIPEDLKTPFDIREILARIVDGSEWEEFKKDYGETLVTAKARLSGVEVGLLANNGILFSESALKAAQFIDLCDRDQIPLLFFQNVPGFMVGKKYEKEGITKHGAKMVMACSLARVPKFTVIVGASFGAGNYGMCGRAYHPRGLWIWPSAKTAVIGGRAAKDVLSSIGFKPEKSSEIEEQYEKESSPYYSTARLWDDGLIDPVDTRRVLTLGLFASLKNAPPLKRKKGLYRM